LGRALGLISSNNREVILGIWICGGAAGWVATVKIKDHIEIGWRNYVRLCHGDAGSRNVIEWRMDVGNKEWYGDSTRLIHLYEDIQVIADARKQSPSHDTRLRLWK
jgi:hypothetical protein